MGEAGGSGLSRPDIVRRLIALGPGVGGGEQLVTLDADEIIATASRVTGLDDFGPPEWEEPFRRLVAALDTEAQLHVLGRLMCRHDALRHLCTRLQVVDALRRSPAIADEPITAPVVITGPARSGTTILQELLGQDPNLRAPLAWEMAHPFPPPAGSPDDRREWAQSEFDLWGDIHQGFRAVHELQAHLPEECLWLLAPEFDGGFWSTCVDIPSWSAFRAGTDPMPAYRMHKTMLQVLQHGAGPARPWALKSPVHVSRLAALFATYPDARVIHTHRDPVRTVPSTVSTLVAGRFVRSDAVDVATTAASIGFGFRFLLVAAAEQRAAGELPDDQIADLHYLDFLRDPVAAIRAAYTKLDLPFTDELPDRIRGYLDARPQDKYGVHKYSATDFGFDVDELRQDYAPYTEAFGIELEQP